MTQAARMNFSDQKKGPQVMTTRGNLMTGMCAVDDVLFERRRSAGSGVEEKRREHRVRAVCAESELHSARGTAATARVSLFSSFFTDSKRR